VGPKPGGRPWRIAISDPRDPAHAIAHVALAWGALATSGDYERSFTLGGRRYSHLLDPRTGWPVEGLASVSVVAPLCVLAGSASTIAMLHGAAGADWLAETGLPHLWVDADGRRGGPLAKRQVVHASSASMSRRVLGFSGAPRALRGVSRS
jgi:thiamine biosynthesis lipoprotein